MTRVTDDPVQALEEYGELWVVTRTTSRGATVHLQSPDECPQLRASNGVRRLDHPAEIPLGAEQVCSRCREDFGDDTAFDRGSDDQPAVEVADD